MKATREELLALLKLVDITRVNEIDCGEFLGRVAGYVERIAAGERPPEGYEDLLHHLQICPECLEEFDALYEAYRSEQ